MESIFQKILLQHNDFVVVSTTEHARAPSFRNIGGQSMPNDTIFSLSRYVRIVLPSVSSGVSIGIHTGTAAGQLPEIRVMSSRFSKKLFRHADIYATRTFPLLAVSKASTTTTEHIQARHILTTEHHTRLRSRALGVNQCQMIQFSHCWDMSGLSCQVSHQEYQLEFMPALLQGSFRKFE